MRRLPRRLPTPRRLRPAAVRELRRAQRIPQAQLRSEATAAADTTAAAAGAMRATAAGSQPRTTAEEDSRRCFLRSYTRQQGGWRACAASSAASYSEPVISYSDPFPAALPLTIITQRCSPGALLHLLDGKSVAQGAHLQGRLCSTARPDPLVPSAVGSPVNSGSKSSFSSSFSRRRCLDFLWRWTSSHCRRTSCT